MIEHMVRKHQCGLCDTKIWHYDGARLRKTAEYNEITVELDDGTSMVVGVCTKHTIPKHKDYAIMTERMHQGWLEEVAFGIGAEDWVQNKGLKLKITGTK